MMETEKSVDHAYAYPVIILYHWCILVYYNYACQWTSLHLVELHQVHYFYYNNYVTFDEYLNVVERSQRTTFRIYLYNIYK